jgi:transcriptional regulator with XRE-family HTH domain
VNNYEFGNYIYQLRKDANLSQQALAEKLGVTNKAVSKWENGQAKPSIDILNSLALLFNISVDDLLLMRKQKELPKITKIVVTGGPCAGKSTAISWIQNAFTKLGYKVIFIPETSTELITAGINLSSCNSPLDFAKGLVKLQLEKEKIYEDIAKEMPYSKILIVCDRGVMDNKAYVKPIDFLSILRDIKSNETILRDSYDAVFHLVSAAKGAEKYYTLENNQARTESIEDAAILDDKIISAWTGHPHFRIIDNSSNFDIKMKKLITEISLFLGEPEPYEIERKFLIEYRDIDWLEKNPKCQRVEIIQTYLKSSNDDEIRVRQRGLDGNYI